jgi:hypothetical protein
MYYFMNYLNHFLSGNKPPMSMFDEFITIDFIIPWKMGCTILVDNCWVVFASFFAREKPFHLLA